MDRRSRRLAPPLLPLLLVALIASWTVLALAAADATAAAPSPSPPLNDGVPTGQAAGPDGAPPGLPDPAPGTVPIRFSVAGPVRAGDRELVLLAVQRSCGVDEDDPGTAVAQVAETDTDIWARVDVAVGPHGRPCESERLVRIPVALTGPLADRTIRDALTDEPAFVNPFDPIDTGLRYTCFGYPGYSVADMLGPGFDVSGRGLSPPPGARAVADSGDVVSFLGPFRRGGRARFETRVFTGASWSLRSGQSACLPRVALVPGLEGATWSLRGRRPSPRSRRLAVWVQERGCASGRPPVGRIARPIVQFRPDSIVVIIATEPLLGAQDCPGAPPAPYTVRLPVRLGDRRLYDGGVFPPREPRWRWGALAVVDDEPGYGLDAGTGPGRLSIGRRCVGLRSLGSGPLMTVMGAAHHPHATLLAPRPGRHVPDLPRRAGPSDRERGKTFIGRHRSS